MAELLEDDFNAVALWRELNLLLTVNEYLPIIIVALK